MASALTRLTRPRRTRGHALHRENGTTDRRRRPPHCVDLGAARAAQGLGSNSGLAKTPIRYTLPACCASPAGGTASVPVSPNRNVRRLYRIPRRTLHRVAWWLPTLFNTREFPPQVQDSTVLPVPMASDCNGSHGGLVAHRVHDRAWKLCLPQVWVARKTATRHSTRRKEDRRRLHRAAATAERRYGDRRHRDITRELRRSVERLVNPVGAA